MCIPDGKDFNTTAFDVIFPSDEDETHPISGMDVPVLIVDDVIDEANEQSFVVRLEVVSTASKGALNIGRSVATAVIQDDDGETVQFSSSCLIPLIFCLN